jgi:hypothetical protein
MHVDILYGNTICHSNQYSNWNAYAYSYGNTDKYSHTYPYANGNTNPDTNYCGL